MNSKEKDLIAANLCLLEAVQMVCSREQLIIISDITEDLLSRDYLEKCFKKDLKKEKSCKMSILKKIVSLLNKKLVNKDYKLLRKERV
jgi:hypothetical protein